MNGVVCTGRWVCMCMGAWGVFVGVDVCAWVGVCGGICVWMHWGGVSVGGWV